MKAFTWSVPKRVGVRPKNRDSNKYYFPDLSGNEDLKFSRNSSYAEYNYDKRTLSFEVWTCTPFEWHNREALRKQRGSELARITGADRWLYYSDQPVKSRHEKDRRIYFQQFVIISDFPSEEMLKEAWEVLNSEPIESEEVGEYKYRRSDAGQTPLLRTYKKRQERKLAYGMEQECD